MCSESYSETFDEIWNYNKAWRYDLTKYGNQVMAFYQYRIRRIITEWQLRQVAEIQTLVTNIFRHYTLYAHPLANQDCAEKESGRPPGESLHTAPSHTLHDESLETLYILLLWMPVLVKLLHYIYHEVIQNRYCWSRDLFKFLRRHTPPRNKSKPN